MFSIRFLKGGRGDVEFSVLFKRDKYLKLAYEVHFFIKDLKVCLDEEKKDRIDLKVRNS